MAAAISGVRSSRPRPSTLAFRLSSNLIRASHAERCPALAVDCIQRYTGIEQEGRHDGFPAQCSVVYGGIGFFVGGSRIGPVGKQGHDGIGPALIAVPCRRDQGRHAAMTAIDIDTAGNEGAQQAQIRQDHGVYQHAALIALANQRHRIGIRTTLECGKGEVDLA
jgi:hypothetical protein